MNTIEREHCYPSDMSDEQWAIMEPLLPVNTGAGRPTETDLRAVMDAIFYRTRTGCQWRYLPKSYPPTGTVYYYFRKWAKDGVWSRMNNEIRIQERTKQGLLRFDRMRQGHCRVILGVLTVLRWGVAVHFILGI